MMPLEGWWPFEKSKNLRRNTALKRRCARASLAGAPDWFCIDIDPYTGAHRFREKNNIQLSFAGVAARMSSSLK
jgi:hypothetical protein